MSDNNVHNESERRLQEIGNQMGMPILSPTTHIQVDDDSVRPSQSYEDLDGMTDSQPTSKNPLLQYAVAGAIGLGVVGIPLTILFGLGGAPQTTKTQTAPEVESSTSTLADRELDNLKTQSALDIQSKPEAQTVAQAPQSAPAAPAATPPKTVVAKPQPTPVATAPATPPKVIAAKPQPKPVAKAPAPQPKKIAVQPPTVVAATPASIARPIPTAVARSIAKPIPAPVVPQPRPVPIQVAAVVPAQPPRAVVLPPPLSVEQASALGMFGGDTDKPDTEPLALANSNLSPTLTLPVGVNVAARTITPYTSLSSRNSAINNTETPLSVQLDQPIQLAQGFNLPAGTVVQFGATVNDNGAVTATSKGVFIDGTELKVPVGAFALTASNSTALVANQRSLRDGELNGADNTAAVWGAAGALGKAFSESGNTSVVNTSGLGTSVVQTNSGNVNIPGALLNGAFSPLAKAKESRANALAQELQQSSRLNEIPVQSPVRVFVAAAVAIQIPVALEATAALGTPEQGQSLNDEDVNRPPTMIPTRPISAVNVPAATATPAPVTTTIQPVVAPSPPTTANTQLPTVPTTQAIGEVNAPSPIAPTKPNLVRVKLAIAPTQTSSPVVTQSTIVTPQPVATTTQPVQTPTAATSQPIVAAPLSATRTQSTTIDPAVTNQPTFLPQQPVQEPITTSEPTAVSPLVTNSPSIQFTATQSTFIPPQLPAATTQPAVTPQPTQAVNPPTPIAPTKPNNIVNIQPQSTLPQPSAPAVTQFTVTENLQFELIPIQVDNTGNIQPEISPVSTPTATPLPSTNR